MGNRASRPDLGILLFDAWSRQDGRYTMFNIRIWYDPRYDAKWDHDNHGPYYNRVMDFTWQASEGHEDWYGFRIESSDQASLQDIEEFIKLLRRIYRGSEKHHQFSPIEMAARLRIMGSTQCVYDHRVSDLVPIGEVVSPEHHGWYADVDKIEGVDTHHGCVIAEDEREAQALVIQQYALKTPDRVKPFIDAGEPVKMMSVSWRKDLDVRPVRQQAQLPWWVFDDDGHYVPPEKRESNDDEA